MSDQTPPIRPSKILWVFPPTTQSDRWADIIPSKSVRQLARQVNQLLDQANIVSSAVKLTEEEYLAWHKYYAETMLSQDHEVLASEAWFKKNAGLLADIWLLDFRRDGVRVGASIISRSHEGVFTHHFKASDRLKIDGPDNVSLGLLIELWYAEFCFGQNPSKVTSGLSRNAFGYYNTLGYLAAKLRMGYIPEGAMNRPWDNEFMRKGDQEPTAWFVQRHGEPLTLAMFPSLDQLPGEIATYLNRQNIPAMSAQDILL